MVAIDSYPGGFDYGDLICVHWFYLYNDTLPESCL